MSDFLATPQPPRDSYGRYLVRSLDGSKLLSYTRATTVAETLSDRWNLELWAKRNVVAGLAIDPTLVEEAKGLDVKEHKEELNDIAARAQTLARAHDRAEAGTRMHALAELADLGKPLPDDVTPAEQTDLVAYTAAMKAAGLTVVADMAERVVIHDDLLIAGTLDRIVARGDGRLQVLDLKTGSSVELAIREIAVQLAIYAYATHLYDWATETRSPMPDDLDTTEALVAWLPLGEGRCEIIAVNLMDGFHGLQLAMAVRAWRKLKMGYLTTEVVGVAAPENDTERLELLAHLRRRCKRLSTEFPQAAEHLAKTWPVGAPALLGKDQTMEDLLSILAAVQAVESAHVVPFGETWGKPARKAPKMSAKETARAISHRVD